MKALRLPADAFPVVICFASGLHAFLDHSCPAISAFPGGLEDATWAGVIVQPATRCRLVLTWTLAGSLRFPGVRPVPLLRSKTPAGPTSPCLCRSRRCCPRSNDSEGSSEKMISRLPRGFGTRCLRFTNGVTTAHARLASGWLARLCRRELNPLDRIEGFQIVSFSSSLPELP